jgi:hypothetical protein
MLELEGKLLQFLGIPCIDDGIGGLPFSQLEPDFMGTSSNHEVSQI